MTYEIQPLWHGYIELGANAEMHGHVDTAQAMFDAAFEEIKKLNINDPDMARKMRALGEATLLSGNFKKALVHFKHALAIYNYSLGRDDFDFRPIVTAEGSPLHRVKDWSR
jgi:hypothetical protein